jgi:dipeptidyl aminopeptidase/acylaminoacyl peptidase
MEVGWKLPSATAAIVGWAADGNEVYTGVPFGGAHLGGAPGIELQSVSAVRGESKVLASIPGASVIYSIRPATPDGSILLVGYGQGPTAAGRSAGVLRKDLKTGEQREVIPPGVVSEVSLSPDGTQVAALDREANSASILVKPLEGGAWKTLATLAGTGYMYLNWLPNGDLVFGKEGSTNSAIYRLPAAGGTPQKVAELVLLGHVHEIRVGPNGRQLVFQSYVNHTEFWELENFLPKELSGRP